jgi:aspartyl-tRNA(Asn)/glutamyl-tRNA(Gln) amidotransferase subunit A
LYEAELSHLITSTIFTPYWDVMGNPAVSVPMGWNEIGRPLGLQIIGRPFEDFRALGVAAAFQEATAWHTGPSTAGPRVAIAMEVAA